VAWALQLRHWCRARVGPVPSAARGCAASLRRGAREIRWCLRDYSLPLHTVVHASSLQLAHASTALHADAMHRAVAASQSSPRQQVVLAQRFACPSAFLIRNHDLLIAMIRHGIRRSMRRNAVDQSLTHSLPPAVAGGAGAALRLPLAPPLGQRPRPLRLPRVGLCRAARRRRRRLLRGRRGGWGPRPA
jgi:hypothetical protein